MISAAQKSIEKKDFRAAEVQLKNALQQAPDHKDARFELGAVLLESGDLPGAEKELRRALELGYDREKVIAKLVHALLGQGKMDEIIKEFADIDLAVPADNADVKAAAGTALMSRGKLAEAETAFTAAVRTVPGHPPGRIGQARIMAARGDVVGAQKIADQILAEAPKNRDALKLQIALHIGQGKRDELLATHRKIVEYYPHSVVDRYDFVTRLVEAKKVTEAASEADAMAKFAPSDPRTHHAQSLVAYEQNNFAGAKEFATKALARSPGFYPALLTAGAASLRLRNYQQAIQYLTEFTQAHKGIAQGHFFLVAAYLAADQTQSASRALKAGLEQFPKDPKLLLIAGEVAAKEKNLAAAAKYFELSAQQGDASGLASTSLGQTLLAAGKEDEGLRVLEQLSKASSNNVQSDLVLVRHHMRRKEWDKALKWIESVGKKQPDSALASNLRGMVHLGKQDFPGARKQFEQALAKDGGSLVALDYLARLDLREKKPEDAKRRYETAYVSQPKNEQLAVSLAHILAAAGEKPENAIAPLRALIRQVPAAEGARFKMVEILLLGGQVKQAMAAAQEGVSSVPGSQSLKLALGETQLAAKEYPQALLTFGEVLQQNPKSLNALIHTAQIHEAMGDYGKALEVVNKVLEIAPGEREVARSKVGLHMRAGEIEKSLQVARALRTKSPKDARAHQLEAGVLASMNRWNEAADRLKEAIRLSPPSAALVVRLHKVLVEGRNGEEASKLAADGLKRHPEDVEIRVYLAEHAAANKDMRGAVSLYQQALAIQPKNPQILNNLAWAADQINDPKALGYAEEANKLAPDAPMIMDTLGTMLVSRGDTQRGIALLEKASKDAPQRLDIRFNFAKALVKVGRKDDAKRELSFLKGQGDRFAGQADLDKLVESL